MSHRWLYAWALGSAAFGGASLIVPLSVVSLGGDPVTIGVLAAVAAFVGVPGALAFGGGVGSIAGGWLATSSYVLAFAVTGRLVLAGAAVVLSLWYRTTAVSESDRSAA